MRPYALLFAALAACSASEAPTARLALNVAPLELNEVTDATWRIAVHNAATDLVWQKDITSARYGTGRGDLAYVGTCDAAASPNTVTLTLLELRHDGAVIPADTYANPTPLQREVVCVENADTRVDFNVTLLRDAVQGFFDVAVNFDQVFCSAKLDCQDALLHDASGERGPTAVVAFACTSGNGTPTYLYSSDVTLTCDDKTYTLDRAATPGQHGPIAPGIFQTAAYIGREDLGQADLDKCYWNTAFGLGDELGTNCTLSLFATAARASWSDGAAPTGWTWPVVRWSVPITDALGERTCGAHALNAEDSGVDTFYADAPHFRHRMTCADTTIASFDDAPDWEPPEPDGEPEPLGLAITVVDDTGVAISGLTLTRQDGDLALPNTLAHQTYTPLSGTITACDGTLTLPANLVPAPDTTLTVTLPANTITAATTPGVNAVKLVIPQYRPIMLWNFEDATSQTTLNRDAVSGWRCTLPGVGVNSSNHQFVTQQVASPVGHGVTGLPDYLQTACYARPNIATDASAAQRAWMKSGDSRTVELLFDNTQLLRDGVYARMFSASWLQLDYTGNSFTLVVTPASGTAQSFSFSLNGVGVRSREHFARGWHHVAVTYDKPSGQIRLYLDGVNPDGFVGQLGANTTLHQGGTITGGFLWGGTQFRRFRGSIDEVAGYAGALSPGMIYQHAVDALTQGRPYGICERGQILPDTDLAATDIGGIDERNVAPGWHTQVAPNIYWFRQANGTLNPDTLTPLAQLQHFQAPRYRPGHTLPPNQDWLDLSYLSATRSGSGGNVVRSASAQAALNEELASFWHYVLTLNNNLGIAGAPPAGLVALANTHPEWKTYLITNWHFVNPASRPAAYDQDDLDYLGAHGMSLISGRPFVKGTQSQLSLEHFPNDGTAALDSDAIKSPSAPTYTWTLDGKALKIRLDPFITALAPRIAAGANAVDYVNENGEVSELNGMRVDTADPVIAAEFANWQPTITNDRSKLFQGFAFGRAVQAYFAPLAQMPELSDTVFTHYALDGNRTYRVRWETARIANTPVDGHPRPTPDFYPRYPSYSYHGQSAWHGIHWLAGSSRFEEIAAGDKLYWPFLSPGWADNPTANILPGQWLGLLKIVAVLGADGWFAGHFSVDPAPYPEPEGWLWQAAMPAYAHAITSRYEDILRQGDLVQARGSWMPQAANYFLDDYYKLYTKLPQSELVYARRLNDEWVLAGAIHSTSNTANTMPLYRMVDVHLSVSSATPFDAIVTLPFRRQGSVYRWNRATTPPTLVQLDRWHEPWHPYYWSRDFLFDAEVDDGRVAASASSHAWTTYTDGLVTGTLNGLVHYDYSHFTTSLRVIPADQQTWSAGANNGSPSARYDFQPRQTANYHVWIRARTQDDSTGNAYLTIGEGSPSEASQTVVVDGDVWTWYRTTNPYLNVAQAFHDATQTPHVTTHQTLTLRPGSAQLEVDQIIVTQDPNRDPSTEPPESTLREVGDLH